MSYEKEMLKKYSMPSRHEVERSLLRTLLKHGGSVREFNSNEAIVTEIADEFGLSDEQRAAVLERTYTKEKRLIKAPLWNRLLFRAADALAKDNLVCRPTQTLQLTKRREWMVTEKGLGDAMRVAGIPIESRDSMPTRSYEVQKIVKKIIEQPRKDNYEPIDSSKRIALSSRQSVLRNRGFRQAVIEAYDRRCAVCGLKLNSPNRLSWEVEAAHIVPNRVFGRDDIFNGLALCRFHHWAFDVGWFTLSNEFEIELSRSVLGLPTDFGKSGLYDLVRSLSGQHKRLQLPTQRRLRPHENALRWHRKYVFQQDQLKGEAVCD